MTLRTSATVLRAIVGLALAFGFLGFATHSHAPHIAEAAPVAHVELAQLPTAAEL
jgi:hypothetical protein